MAEEDTPRLERGYRLVMNSVFLVGGLFVVALVGIGALAAYNVKTGLVSAMLTAVTGVTGSLVGAYFGIQVGNRLRIEPMRSRKKLRTAARRQKK